MDMDYILNSNLDEQLTEPLELYHSTCFYCNGFYGPCFGEPVCATCHEFLFSEDLELFQRTVRWPASWFGEKDDGDSGNDEPSEEAGPSNQVPNIGAQEPNHPADLYQEEEQEEEADEESPPPSPAEEDVEMEILDNDPDAEQEVQEANPPLHPLPIPELPEQQQQQDEDNENEHIFVHARHFFPHTTSNGPTAGPSFARPPQRPPYDRPQDRLNNRLSLLTTPRPAYETVPTSDDMSLRLLPNEIWSAIFLKLDDISLCMSSKVSRKFKAIVLDQNPNSKWEEYVRLRWPLFHPTYQVENWYNVYCDFIDSVPCKLCFINLALHLPFDDFQPTRSLRSVRLHKELKWLRVDHPEGIEAVPLDELNYNWLARISGPPQSPYQGGVFYLNLKVPHDYPLKPPVVRFLSRIIHPNISRHGDIGIDCIQHNWTLALTIPQILLSVQSLLTDPYLETNMEPVISNLYENDRQKFDKIARIWTWKYAMHDVLVH